MRVELRPGEAIAAPICNALSGLIPTVTTACPLVQPAPPQAGAGVPAYPEGSSLDAGRGGAAEGHLPPVSVAAGHYYQGRIGQRFYGRLTEAGVIDLGAAGFEDDAGSAAGVGFTDVVKRPTTRAHALRPGELDHGRWLLDDKLARVEIPRVLFTFKAGSEALLGPLDGHGLIVGRTLAGAHVFVVPGPMERSDRVRRALRQLADWWAS